MKKLRAWLVGKKTYIVAGAVALAALAGVFFGKLSFAQATALLGFAGAIAGLGAKIDHHAAQVTAVLTDVAKLSQDVAWRRYGVMPADAIATAQDGAKLVQAVKADGN
ncbi:MAG TPA: hypothetical protein VFW25_02350 [Silvibacterium sp.]|nr:hypothetical protein [Silvibacterium sp.]